MDGADLKDDVSHPAGHRRPRLQQLLHVTLADARGETMNRIGIDPGLAELGERLQHGVGGIGTIVENRCAAVPERETSTGRVLHAGATTGRLTRSCPHLGREAETVCGGSTRGCKPVTALGGDRIGKTGSIGAQDP